MSMWFGPCAFARSCEPDNRAAIPIGHACAWCDDPIMPDDMGYCLPDAVGRPQVFHLNCHLRQLIGGVNHLRGQCQCYGGEMGHDPPGLTKREAADAAVEIWNAGAG